MRLAFVIPWFGLDIPGGAESACRDLAIRLHEAGVPVEVLTTCIREFRSDWGQNYYPPGTEVVRGIPVHRFGVGERDAGAFARINGRLLQNLPITPAEEAAFMREMIRCDDLIRFIEEQRDTYVYAYIPYMFPTTYWGVLACPDRAVLIPCLHDESYAYLPLYRPVFERVRGLAFHTRSEMRLARRLYSLRPDAPALLGTGVEPGSPPQPGRFRHKYGLDRFLLYAGRKDATKNAPLLVEYFCRYKELRPGDLKLVLLGDGPIAVPAGHEHEVLDLGFVAPEDKHDAYAAALLLCQPSLNESFSLVLLEAWLAGAPVLAHADCPVTRDHCLASNGGLFFASFEEFRGCLDYLQNNPERAQQMARNGRRYVLENYTWDRVVERYLQALDGWGFGF